jgi:crotonobetainyl-CoA:carnitine CoA-transferase CaiB-like acyl-CoA transferase
MNGLLSGVRVLDLTRALAGPYGTMLLGDLGAEVIKIEDHAGDITRLAGPIELNGMSAYFLSANRNKKSVVIDLRTPEGRAVFYDLVKVFDVVVDNMRPRALRRLQCDYDDIKPFNPKIISCSLSGYGHTGPDQDLPAFDLSIQARAGGMSLTGEEGRPPVKMGIPIGDLAGGMFAALAIVSALRHRDQTGRGQKLDLSLLDCQISMTTYLASYYFMAGVVAGPQGSRHESIAPYEAFPTQDIWVVVACATPKFWEGFCRALGLEELLEDERFDNMYKRRDNIDALVPILRERFQQKPAGEWIRLLEKEDVPCAPVNPIDRALNDPQVLTRDMIVELEHPKVGKFKLPGNPIKSSEAEDIFAPPPEHGEHTEHVLRQELGYSGERISELRDAKAIG